MPLRPEDLLSIPKHVSLLATCRAIGLALDDNARVLRRGDRKIKNTTAYKAGKIVRDMELDCEIRSVENIKKWKLPLKINNYIQLANSYIYFYTYSLKVRKWCNLKSPYRVKSIVNIMPDYFVEDYDDLDPKYEELFERYCVY